MTRELVMSWFLRCSGVTRGSAGEVRIFRRISMEVSGSQRVSMAQTNWSRLDTSMSSSTTMTNLQPYTTEPQVEARVPACRAWPG